MAFLGLLALAGVAAVAAVGPAPASPPLLPAGRAEIGRLAAREVREWTLELAAGELVRLGAAPVVGFADGPFGLTLRVLTPDGVVVEEAEAASGVQGRLAFTAVESGRFLVTVRAASGGQGGWFRLGLEERRPGRAGDGVRLEIERALQQAAAIAAIAAAPGDADEQRARWSSLLGAALVKARGEGLADLEARVWLARSEGATSPEEVTANLDAAWEAVERSTDLAVRAEVTMQRAHVATARFENAAAEEGLRRALADWTDVGSDHGRGRALARLATLGLRRGAHDEAAQFASESVPLLLRWGDVDEAAQALTNEAGALRQKGGDPEMAEERALQAVILARIGASPATLAACLSRLGGMLSSRGELEPALAAYQEALAVALGDGTDPDARGPARRIRLNVGVTLFRLGRPEEAREPFEQVLAAYGQEESREALAGREEALRGLGAALFELGDGAGSIARLEESLRVNGRRTGEWDRSKALAATLQWLGRARMGLGRLPEGIGDLQEALALRLETQDHEGESYTRLELGRGLGAVGEVGEARTQLRQAIVGSGAVGLPLNQAWAEIALAGLELDQGNSDDAARLAEDALARVEQVRSELSDDQRRTEFFSESRLGYEVLIEALLRKAGSEAGTEEGEALAAAAFAASERARARGLLDLLEQAALESERLRREAAWLARALGAVEGLSAQMTQDGSGLAHRLEIDRDGFERQRARIAADLKRRQPLAPSEGATGPLDLERTRVLLHRDQALLEYFVGLRASYLFVVTADRLTWHRLPGRERLRGSVETFRRAMETWQGRAELDYLDSARQLFRELLPEPALAELSDRREWVISPDGLLHRLAFETLLTEDLPSGRRVVWAKLPFLLRLHPIRYVPSASVLAEVRDHRRTGPPQAAGPANRFVAFAPFAPGAGPVSNAAVSRGKEWPPLPASRLEVEQIARAFPGHAEVFLEAAASEARFKRFPFVGGTGWVHFATHGEIDDEHPEKTGLVLAAGEGEDGLLTAAEILALHGFSSRLVVLSACRTGRGKMVSGEGIVGLTRAFLYAGSPAVVVSLWNVDDQATAELMLAFQRAFAAGGELSEVFRRARLELIDAGRFSRPNQWAPFIMVGE